MRYCATLLGGVGGDSCVLQKEPQTICGDLESPASGQNLDEPLSAGEAICTSDVCQQLFALTQADHRG